MLRDRSTNDQGFTEVETNIPRPISEIISPCIQLDPDRRYQWAEEVDVNSRDLAWSPQAAVNQLEDPGGYRCTLRAAHRNTHLFGATPGTADAAHRSKSLYTDFANKTGDPVLSGTLEAAD